MPPATAVRADANFHTFPWSWRLFVLLEIICVWHTPLNFHTWISEGQDQSAVSRRGQLTCLKVKAIFHIWESMCFGRPRLVIWPPCLNSFYSFILIWNLEKSHQICARWFGHVYFYKINSKSEWEKHLKSSWKPLSSMGTGKGIYILLKLAITH